MCLLTEDTFEGGTWSPAIAAQVFKLRSAVAAAALKPGLCATTLALAGILCHKACFF